MCGIKIELRRLDVGDIHSTGVRLSPPECVREGKEVAILCVRDRNSTPPFVRLNRLLKVAARKSNRLQGVLTRGKLGGRPGECDGYCNIADIIWVRIRHDRLMLGQILVFNKAVEKGSWNLETTRSGCNLFVGSRCQSRTVRLWLSLKYFNGRDGMN